MMPYQKLTAWRFDASSTLLAKDLGFLQQEQANEIESRREHASKLTWGLYKSVSRNATKRPAAA